ncbi:MAG: GyrI-like domain-containing protein [Actinomycetota bacterium]
MAIDLKRALKPLYTAPLAPEVIEVPPRRFIMVDGTGSPTSGTDYQAAFGALYSVAYTAKFTLKKAGGVQFSVMPLETLWWNIDGRLDLDSKAAWHWRAMIAMPDEVTAEDIEAARKAAAVKHASPSLKKLRFKEFHEGLCVQVMHVGPYSAERETIERLHAFATAQGYKLHGKHHEIYLGDPRRTKPEKLKTIIRQPVR